MAPWLPLVAILDLIVYEMCGLLENKNNACHHILRLIQQVTVLVLGGNG